jgi:hypothetical protein
MLQEGGASARQIPAASRPPGNPPREKRATQPKLVLAALGQKSLQDRGAAELDGKPMALSSFVRTATSFASHRQAEQALPVQSEILEDDPLERRQQLHGALRRWRKIDSVMLPFSLRYAQRQRTPGRANQIDA